MAVTEGFRLDERGRVIVGLMPNPDLSHLDGSGGYTPSYASSHAPFTLAGVTHSQMLAQAILEGVELPIYHGEVGDTAALYAKARAIDEDRATQIITDHRNRVAAALIRGSDDDD